MPEYRCKNCGKHFFGWAGKGICLDCGGKLVPVNEIARYKEINKEKE
jgi:rRNA maturation endonuclease Nob1